MRRVLQCCLVKEPITMPSVTRYVLEKVLCLHLLHDRLSFFFRLNLSFSLSLSLSHVARTPMECTMVKVCHAQGALVTNSRSQTPYSPAFSCLFLFCSASRASSCVCTQCLLGRVTPTKTISTSISISIYIGIYMYTGMRFSSFFIVWLLFLYVSLST
ncbi:hypothetical protein LMJF_31_0420 [Leishmania major strain Friedlin]|uniref:Uncharacterized protein n=1 Tax=Leishmania major TaxID=5664 RepID=Q4Q6M1_LEIMA|nr:hypothetical protein LMJF_31_0420 [Leishmania major strain Friedlin]CAG9579193.1 hypothetical_protein_-_conserved [Leishmania major strain Friedlin]CAJ08229.1 hypothetical protein LMJF_31_0420 [Leishmania major strain Friedlin]|eukprot:XP_001685027.1 hypothetical protein LMJF_31_0420 [Leishmania major strain Friedlin]